eukprot:1182448-Prorocentrum_minimum.AAC.22
MFIYYIVLFILLYFVQAGAWANREPASWSTNASCSAGGVGPPEASGGGRWRCCTHPTAGSARAVTVCTSPSWVALTSTS